MKGMHETVAAITNHIDVGTPTYDGKLVFKFIKYYHLLKVVSM